MAEYGIPRSPPGAVRQPGYGDSSLEFSSPRYNMDSRQLGCRGAEERLKNYTPRSSHKWQRPSEQLVTRKRIGYGGPLLDRLNEILADESWYCYEVDGILGSLHCTRQQLLDVATYLEQSIGDPIEIFQFHGVDFIGFKSRRQAYDQERMESACASPRCVS